MRSDHIVVCLAFAADSSTLQSPVELVKKREAATPEPAAAKAASKKRIVSDDEDEDASVEEDSESDDVSSHAHGSPSCRVTIPML